MIGEFPSGWCRIRLDGVEELLLERGICNSGTISPTPLGFETPGNTGL